VKVKEVAMGEYSVGLRGGEAALWGVAARESVCWMGLSVVDSPGVKRSKSSGARPAVRGDSSPDSPDLTLIIAWPGEPQVALIEKAYAKGEYQQALT
jgi:hypothetical protein